MKQLKLLLFLLCSGTLVFGQLQQLKITQFSVKNPLPPQVESWASTEGALSFRGIRQSAACPGEVKLVIQVRSNGQVIGGNTPQTAPLMKFSGNRAFTATDILPQLNGIASLKKGNYTISIRFFNIDNVAISDELVRPFVIAGGAEQVVATTPAAPVEIAETPVLNESDLQKGIAPPLTLPGIDANCAACQLVKIGITASTVMSFLANNTFTLTQPFSVSASPLKLIKSIKTDLTYFEFVPDNDDCLACNRNSALWGNMNTGTISGVTGTGGVSRSLTFTFVPMLLPGNFTASLNMTIPPLVACCSGTLKFCIRYTFAFDDCTVCSQTVCYTKKKTGALVATDNPIPVNIQN